MTAKADPQSHYYVQQNRRGGRLEQWRRDRSELRRGEEVEMVDSPVRNARIGMLAGPTTPMPTRIIDARILELAPGQRTSTHRHTHDAVLFVLSGSGRSVIGGQRVEWGEQDSLHTPAGVWHGHEATGAQSARLLVITDAPLVRALGLSSIEDIGHEAPPAPDAGPTPADTASTGTASADTDPTAADPSGYGYDLAHRTLDSSGTTDARVHTAFSDVTLRTNPKGTRTALLVDSSLGYRTSGLSIAMFRIAPGQAQSKHRHPGEAFLYIVSGTGYSVVNEQRYDWGPGDIVMVHQYVWHQHFNADPDNPAVVLRVHMWESLIDIMQCAMDPVPLYEDDHAMIEATAGGGVWQQTTPELSTRATGVTA
jgi:gentisate 1,2-dioxygenase